MTTTDYGSWNNYGDPYSLTLDGTVIDAISGDPQWYDRMKKCGAVERIVNDYRDAINAALPERVWLSGNEFIGPYGVNHAEQFATYPLTDADVLDIPAIVASIELWDIVDRHDPDNQ